MERPPFPDCVDNSMRSYFKQCPRKFELGYLENWHTKALNQHLQGGSAFARGLETARRAYYRDGYGEEAAVIGGWNALVEEYATVNEEEYDLKTCARMASALLYYFEHFPMSKDFLIPVERGGKLAVEFSFTLPLDIKHPTTHLPLLYYGRFDMLGQHRDTGDIYVVDEKTTSRLGEQWIESWKLDSQFTGYCAGARAFDYPVVGAIIRGVSILKTGHGVAQSIQMRPQWQIDRWFDQLHRDIFHMIRMWEDGYFDYDLATGCKMYGGCHFREVCASQHPLRWLEADFKQERYAPWENKNV